MDEKILPQRVNCQCMQVIEATTQKQQNFMDPTNQPVNLKFTHLPKATKETLDLLAEQNFLNKDWYLAGGTALTLQFDHRISVDLDFFTPNTEFDPEFIITSLTPLGWITTLREKGTLYGELKGAKISFIAYPYFTPKKPFIPYKNIQVLDVSDIAVMKIIAISQRGKKRDFFDLYWYVENKEPLLEVLKRVNSQFPNMAHNYHHIFKSLTYFDEAEEDPEPQVFFDADWEKIKEYFLKIVPEIANKLL